MEKKIKLHVPETISTNIVRYQGEDIEIKEFVTFEEMLEIVNNCVEGSFDIDGDYIPELTDFYVKKEIVDIYTNIDLGINPIDIYALLYQTDIFNVVLSGIDRSQFEEIKRSIDRKIVHMLRTNEKAHNKEFEDITLLFESIGKRFENTLNKVDFEGFADVINKITDENFINTLTDEPIKEEIVDIDEC